MSVTSRGGCIFCTTWTWLGCHLQWLFRHRNPAGSAFGSQSGCLPPYSTAGERPRFGNFQSGSYLLHYKDVFWVPLAMVLPTPQTGRLYLWVPVFLSFLNQESIHVSVTPKDRISCAMWTRSKHKKMSLATILSTPQSGRLYLWIPLLVFFYLFWAGTATRYSLRNEHERDT